MIKFSVLVICFLSISQSSYASPILPSQGSKIRLRGKDANKIVTGGIKKGKNTFLNFNRFNIPKSHKINFLRIKNSKNIYVIVRDNKKSKIFGSIIADKNLFFINKNGFLIGGNNTFSINKNIYFTTADKIKFQDSSLIETDKLLVQQSSSNAAEFIFKNNKGKIIFKDKGHQILQPGNVFAQVFGVGRSQNGFRQENGLISISAGDIILDGGLITQKNGNITLSAVKTGTISTKNNTNSSDVLNLGNINLRNRALIDSSGKNSEIYILGDTINLNEQSLLISSNNTTNSTKSINVDSKTLNIVSQNKPFESSRFEVARGIVSQTFLNNGADININSDKIRLDKSGGIVAANFGKFKGGDINIKSKNIQVLGGSEFGLRNFGSQLLTATTNKATGSGGDINIVSDNIFINKGGFITAVSLSRGNGGKINVKSNMIRIKGGVFDERIQEFIPSTLGTTSAAAGNGSKTSINSKEILIQDGGRIDASSFQSGNSGKIDIFAKKISVIGKDQDSNTSSSIQSASDRVNALIGRIFRINSEPTGSAGSIDLQAQELDISKSGLISVQSAGTGESGDLNLRVDKIQLSNSKLSASTKDEKGGNISIKSTLLTLNNSQIEANSENEFGGRINIATDSLVPSPGSRISTTSELGPNFEGEINTTVENPQITPPSKLSTLEQPKISLTQLCGYSGSSIAKQGSGDTQEIISDPILLSARDLQQRVRIVSQYQINDRETGTVRPFKRLLGVQDAGQGKGRWIFDPKDSPELNNLITSLEKKCKEVI